MFKHLPKSMVLGHEIILEAPVHDPDDIRPEIVNLWAGFTWFTRHFERIQSHYVSAWVDKRHIFFDLFVPMFDKNPIIANKEELDFRLRDIARKRSLVVKDAKPKMLMSVVYKDGSQEHHGAVFEIEFHEPNLRDPF